MNTHEYVHDASVCKLQECMIHLSQVTGVHDPSFWKLHECMLHQSASYKGTRYICLQVTSICKVTRWGHDSYVCICKTTWFLCLQGYTRKLPIFLRGYKSTGSICLHGNRSTWSKTGSLSAWKVKQDHETSVLKLQEFELHMSTKRARYTHVCTKSIWSICYKRIRAPAYKVKRAHKPSVCNVTRDMIHLSTRLHECRTHLSAK